MEPVLNRLGGYTILKESDNKKTIHVQLAKGKVEQKDESGISKFDSSRSIADQLSEQLRNNVTYQQDEIKK